MGSVAETSRPVPSLNFRCYALTSRRAASVMVAFRGLYSRPFFRFMSLSMNILVRHMTEESEHPRKTYCSVPNRFPVVRLPNVPLKSIRKEDRLP